MARRGLALFIARTTARGRPRVRVCVGAIGRSRALAAGATFTNRTTSAPWHSRWSHTSVINATGAIYVIGGRDGSDRDDTFYNDVWVSTDGGA